MSVINAFAGCLTVIQLLAYIREVSVQIGTGADQPLAVQIHIELTCHIRVPTAPCKSRLTVYAAVQF